MPKLKPGELSPKAQRFIEEYLSDPSVSGREAAIRAGYSRASASSIAEELLRKPVIKEAVDKRMAELAERCAVSVETITKQLMDAYELAMCGVVDRGEGKLPATANASANAAVAAAMGLAKLHGLIVDKKAETTVDGKPLPPAQIKVMFVSPKQSDPEGESA